MKAILCVIIVICLGFFMCGGLVYSQILSPSDAATLYTAIVFGAVAVGIALAMQ